MNIADLVVDVFLVLGCLTVGGIILGCVFDLIDRVLNKVFGI